MLELILVMALLALSAALVAPALAKFSRGRRAQDAAADIVAMTHYARDQAERESVAYRFCVDAKSGSYWLEVQRDGAFQPLATNLGQTMTVPDSVALAWEEESAKGSAVSSDASGAAANGFVEFTPDGAHDPATLLLTDADGRVTRISGEFPAESFRVTTAGGSGAKP